MARIWIDVEDVFVFALGGGRRPTGIQRLAYELCRAIVARVGEGQVRFVRHERGRSGLAVIRWAEVEALFAGLTEAAAPARVRLVGGDQPGRVSALRRVARRVVGGLPDEVREPLGRMLKAQLQALAAGLGVLRGGVALARRLATGRGAAGPRGDAAAFRREVAAGDLLFVPGAAYVHADYPGLLARLRAAHGLRVALLLYDIIPVRRPEFVERTYSAGFTDWLDRTLPLCERLFAISRSAASEVEDHAARHGIRLAGPVTPIPIGTGFSTDLADTPPQGAGLPAPGSYVLFVSTLEARKNHLLLFRVWRRLLDQMPADQVPALVFAGRVGWMVGDLMQQMRNTDFLGGKVVLVEHPSDGALAALYRGCLFTVFPSFYEGWGLPVTESLAFGKPGIVSNATSLPEAGGALARYFDPDDVLGATALIRGVIEDPAALAAWTEQVAREFVPVSWDASARAVLEGLA